MHGVMEGESELTSTAGGGTYLMEFALLSQLTGNDSYEEAALRALRQLYNRTSDLGLVGNHINVRARVRRVDVRAGAEPGHARAIGGDWRVEPF